MSLIARHVTSRNPMAQGPSAAPSNLSVDPEGWVGTSSEGKLRLYWTNGDTSAWTYAYVDGVQKEGVAGGVTTMLVTGLASNTAYTVQVKHSKNGVESAGSNTASATTFKEYGLPVSSYCGGNGSNSTVPSDDQYTFVTTKTDGFGSSSVSLNGDSFFSTSCWGCGIANGAGTANNTFSFTVSTAGYYTVLVVSASAANYWNESEQVTYYGGQGGYGRTSVFCYAGDVLSGFAGNVGTPVGEGSWVKRNGTTILSRAGAMDGYSYSSEAPYSLHGASWGGSGDYGMAAAFYDLDTNP